MSSNLENNPTRGAPDAPSCLFWLVWLAFALVTVSGWLRMIHAIRNWHWLTFAEIWPGPLYLAVTGGLWGMVGLVVVLFLFLRWPWSRLAAFGAALLFALTFWADRLLFSRAPGSQSNALFALLVTLLSMGAALLILRPWDELKILLARRGPVERRATDE